MARAGPRDRDCRRKDYTRAVTLIVATALCGALWVAAAEAIVHAIRR